VILKEGRRSDIKEGRRSDIKRKQTQYLDTVM
jgi:hypothetical protein